MESIRHEVWQANMALPKHRLVTLTWGNVSGVDREWGVMFIKPSGVPYDLLAPEDLVTINLKTGDKIDGKLRPSSDTQTHLALYRRFPQLGGIVHTHSHWATVWAQAGFTIPAYGTTHADTFLGDIPCVPALSAEEVAERYELSTGLAIARWFENKGLDPLCVPGCIQAFHGAFAWGTSPAKALEHAVVLEEVAALAFHTQVLARAVPAQPLPGYIADKHFQRKHGKNAYYGQEE